MEQTEIILRVTPSRNRVIAPQNLLMSGRWLMTEGDGLGAYPEQHITTKKTAPHVISQSVKEHCERTRECNGLRYRMWTGLLAAQIIVPWVPEVTRYRRAGAEIRAARGWGRGGAEARNLWEQMSLSLKMPLQSQCVLKLRVKIWPWHSHWLNQDRFLTKSVIGPS